MSASQADGQTDAATAHTHARIAGCRFAASHEMGGAEAGPPPPAGRPVPPSVLGSAPTRQQQQQQQVFLL